MSYKAALIIVILATGAFLLYIWQFGFPPYEENGFFPTKEDEIKDDLPNGDNPIQDTPVACTQEAMLCPDGTAVGRVGPNCEFAPCPGE